MSSQTLINYGTGGTALDARFGSSAGVDSNDPKFLAHTGTNYIYFPGGGINQATIPDPAWMSGAVELDMRFVFAPDDWTPAANSVFVAQGGTTAAITSVVAYLTTTGFITLSLSDGAAFYSATSSANLSANANEAMLAIRVTWRGSDGLVQIFTKATQESTHLADIAANSAWTQLGTDLTMATVTAVLNVSGALSVGGYAGSASAPFIGKVYAAWVATTIDGTAQYFAQFSTNTSQTSFTESSSNAATVTIVRHTTGRKTVMVTRPIILFGTDDYLEIADNALLDFAETDSFTIMMVVRAWAHVADQVLVAKRAVLTGGVADTGWSLFKSSTSAGLQMDDGAVYVVDAQAGAVAGTEDAIFGVRDVTADTLRVYRNTTTTAATTDTTTATLANSNTVRIGRLSGGGASYLDGEVRAVAIWRRALTAAEVAAVCTYYA